VVVAVVVAVVRRVVVTAMRRMWHMHHERCYLSVFHPNSHPTNIYTTCSCL
jgi:hypothetical protein